MSHTLSWMTIRNRSPNLPRHRQRQKAQQEDCLAEFGVAILKGRAMLSQVSQMPDFTEEDNPFIRWEKGVEGEGIGDPTANKLLRALLKEKNEAEASKVAHRLQTRPPVGSIISILDGETNKWKKGEVLRYSGQWKQKASVYYDANTRVEEDLSKVDYQVVKAAHDAPSSTMDSGKSTVSMKKSKTASLDDKLWELREHTHGLRKLQKELVGRVRSLRFFQSVRDLQQAKLDDSIKCGACGKKFAKSNRVLSTCGHIKLSQLPQGDAENQECGVADCTCATRDTSVVTAVSLGTEGATSKAQKTDGGVGVHGSKIIDVVSHIKSLPWRRAHLGVRTVFRFDATSQ